MLCAPVRFSVFFPSLTLRKEIWNTLHRLINIHGSDDLKDTPEARTLSFSANRYKENELIDRFFRHMQQLHYRSCVSGLHSLYELVLPLEIDHWPFVVGYARTYLKKGVIIVAQSSGVFRRSLGYVQLTLLVMFLKFPCIFISCATLLRGV